MMKSNIDPRERGNSKENLSSSTTVKLTERKGHKKKAAGEGKK